METEKNEEDIAKEKFKKNENSVKGMSECIRNNELLMLDFIEKNAIVMQDVSKELKNDKVFIKKAIMKNCMVLKYVAESIKNDKEIIMEAVKKNGWALKFASNRLKEDRDVALEAIKQNGYVVRELKDELRNDKQIILTAMKSGLCLSSYATRDLIKDDAFINEILEMNGVNNSMILYDKECVFNTIRKNKKIKKILQERYGHIKFDTNWIEQNGDVIEIIKDSKEKEYIESLLRDVETKNNIEKKPNKKIKF